MEAPSSMKSSQIGLAKPSPKPFDGGSAGWRREIVVAGRPDVANAIACAERAIEPADRGGVEFLLRPPLADCLIDPERTRRDQGGDVSEGHRWRAVFEQIRPKVWQRLAAAGPLGYRPVTTVLDEIRYRPARKNHLDPWLETGGEYRGMSAVAMTGDSNSPGVHERERLQIINRALDVPAIFPDTRPVWEFLIE
jgi:hypothetical protein